MTLIKSISGIRGTVGGKPGDSLTPIDIVRFVAAFGTWIKRRGGKKVVIGRDARISGPMVSSLATSTLQGLGLDVVNLGLSTTPTVQIAVPMENAGGGIILTASHNPIQWNALKLLNEKGEFISGDDGKLVLSLAAADDIEFAPVDKLGKVREDDRYISRHIALIKKHPLVDAKAIKNAKFKVVVDAVNSSGGIAVPELLKALGVRRVEKLYCEPNGKFPHNPEPLPEHLKKISSVVKKGKFDLGIVVDPDVDRLAFIQEDGKPFGEEYTLVAVADYVLSRKKGNTVSNLSSTRALRDITEKANGKYTASAVGEAYVVAAMKTTRAVIGGEGNGGIIVPDLHYGRDALIGIALFLSHLARSKKTVSELRSGYPAYFISKNRMELTSDINVDRLLEQLKSKYRDERIDTVDGVRIDFEKEKEWIQLRRSNTEPIIRIFAESQSEQKAAELAGKIMGEIREMSKFATDL